MIWNDLNMSKIHVKLEENENKQIEIRNHPSASDSKVAAACEAQGVGLDICPCSI